MILNRRKFSLKYILWNRIAGNTYEEYLSSCAHSMNIFHVIVVSKFKCLENLSKNYSWKLWQHKIVSFVVFNGWPKCTISTCKLKRHKMLLHVRKYKQRKWAHFALCGSCDVPFQVSAISNHKRNVNIQLFSSIFSFICKHVSLTHR